MIRRARMAEEIQPVTPTALRPRRLVMPTQVGVHAFAATGTARRGWCACAHHDGGQTQPPDRSFMPMDLRPHNGGGDGVYGSKSAPTGIRSRNRSRCAPGKPHPLAGVVETVVIAAKQIYTRI